MKRFPDYPAPIREAVAESLSKSPRFTRQTTRRATNINRLPAEGTYVAYEPNGIASIAEILQQVANLVAY